MSHLVSGYSGVGVQPRVLSAMMVGVRVRVTFDEPMNPNAALLLAANYTITEDVGSVARTCVGVVLDPDDDASVLLTLDGACTTGIANYNVAVDLAVEDLAGNTLDPAFDDADFDGFAPSPEVHDHVQLALDRLIEQYRHLTRTRNYLAALVTPLQGIEQALADFRAFRSLATAFGVQLDGLGQSMNMPREGLIDAEYRNILFGRAHSRSSSATGNDVIDILILLDGGFSPSDVEVIEHFEAGFISTILVPINRNDLGFKYAEIVRRVKPNAVRGMLMWQQQGQTHFVWSGDTGEGFAEESDPSGTGGVWAEAV